MRGTIHITDGKIASIDEDFPKNIEHTFDFRGKYILPGLIEVHGHLREPGLEHKEDIPHGTRAGLAGGYTTIFDMPNTRPPTTTVARVEDQIKRYTGRSYSDFAINMGTSVEDIARIFEILGERKIMALLHAENQELVNYFTRKYRDTLKRDDPAVWGDARNTSVVLTSALEMIALAKQFGVKLYLLHLSTPEEFAAVEFGRKIGVDVYGEVAAYHLAFTCQDYEKYGNLINVAPALRTPAEQKQLWRLLSEGKIDAVISEHTPHTLAEKQKESVWEVASGMPGMQEALPVLISNWVKQFGHDALEKGLMRIAQVTSQNIARIFGFAQKGGLAVGKDADMVVVDTRQVWRVKKADLFTKNRWSAYEGMELMGRPVATFLRGRLVYREGTIIGEAQGERIARCKLD